MMNIQGKSSGKAYSVLAAFYEKLSEEDDYENRGDYLVFLANKYSTGIKCADLACGSGYFTRRLKRAGYNVYGCDISDEMLTEAENLAMKERLNIGFVHQDLAKFRSIEKLDLVTVINDGFNYLDEKKFTSALRAISANLKQGGVLIFDVSSEYKIKNIIADNVFAEDLDDLTYLWFNELDGNKLTMSLTFFIKDGAKYIRKDEVHVQYAHSLEFIESELKKASFDILEECGELGEKLTGTSRRLCFVAKKK